jgi:hypothetical protein
LSPVPRESLTSEMLKHAEIRQPFRA